MDRSRLSTFACATAWPALALALGTACAQTSSQVNEPPAMGTQPGATQSPSTATTPAASGSDSSAMTPLPGEPTAAGGNYEARSSWIPYTTSGYVGISAGTARLDTDCAPGLKCDDPNWAGSIYTGGMFSPYFGLQVGYFQLGNANRNGGDTKAKGVTILLTGLVPLGNNFSLIGRAGAAYGWTRTSAIAGLAPSGDEKGFGPSFGAGVAWDFDRNWSVSLDWDRSRLHYAGNVKRDTDITSIGLRYRF